MAEWPYSTARWQRLRKRKLRESPLCEHCEMERRVTPATEVDHRIAISNGGDPFPGLEGLASYCHPCHTRKTKLVDSGKADRLPVRGVDPITGKPLDPSHPFNEKISQG